MPFGLSPSRCPTSLAARMADQAAIPATADTIERALGIPARTIRRWAATGAIKKARRGQYDVRQVLAERDRRAAGRPAV